MIFFKTQRQVTTHKECRRWASKKVSTTINGIKVTAVIRWQGLTEKTKRQFNKELANAILKGDKDG